MEAEARYTKVGLAVLGLLAALVAAVLWLANVGSESDFRRYTIHFEQQALDGLQVGADVSLRGIKVGRVQDYALAADKFNRVRVEIRVDKRTPVRSNTVAMVSRNFVTGIAAIALVTPEPPGEPLVAVAEGERYPVIKEGRSGMDEIAGRVHKVGDMAATTLTQLNQLLSGGNQDEVMNTVTALRDLARGLNARLGLLDRTLEQMGTAATQIGTSGERMAGVAESSGRQLDTTLAEAAALAAEARLALQQASQTMTTLQVQGGRAAQRLETTAANVDDQLSVAVTELRVAIDGATRVFDRLSDPQAALLGAGKQQLGPGEKQP